MKILPISENYRVRTIKKLSYDEPNQTVQSNQVSSKQDFQSYAYVPNFGYCEPHMRLMKNLNNKFSIAINDAFAEYTKALEKASEYKQKLSLADGVHTKAAQMLAQYSNYQYSMAEVIPSYAMENSTELMNAFNKTRIFTDPVDIMLTISNIPKLVTKTGIDKNTNQPYLPEQMRRSAANTQLYSSILLIEMLDKNLSSTNLDSEAKNMVMDLRKEVLESISKIYGDDAFDRIQALKTMGLDASVEDKRKSLALVQEFDDKAQELNFSENFYNKLADLINHQNKVEGRTVEKNLVDIKIPEVVLKYHTHPQGEHTHHHTHTMNGEHTHDHEHLHDYMHAHGIEHTHSSIQTNLKKN